MLIFIKTVIANIMWTWFIVANITYSSEAMIIIWQKSSKNGLTDCTFNSWVDKYLAISLYPNLFFLKEAQMGYDWLMNLLNEP